MPANLPYIFISTRTGKNIMALLDMLYELSEIIRMFTKRPDKEGGKTASFVIAAGSALKDFAVNIHHDFLAIT